MSTWLMGVLSHLRHHHHMLEITITVSREIQLLRLRPQYMQVIHSGMGSSVKVSAAAMENLVQCGASQLHQG